MVRRSIIVAVGSAGGLAVAAANRKLLLEQLVVALAAFEAMGPPGMALYVLSFVAATLVMVPTAPLEMAAGLLFVKKYGLNMAIFLAAFAKITSQAIAFILGRTLLHDFVKAHVLPKFPIFSATAKAIREKPFKMTCVIRFAPIPTIAKSLGLAACGSPFPVFLVASALFGIPWSILGVVAGSTLVSLAELFDGRGEARLKEISSQVLDPLKERPLVLGAGFVFATFIAIFAVQTVRRIAQDALADAKESSSRSE